MNLPTWPLYFLCDSPYIISTGLLGQPHRGLRSLGSDIKENYQFHVLRDLRQSNISRDYRIEYLQIFLNFNKIREILRKSKIG